jgi:hypothetical protein
VTAPSTQGSQPTHPTGRSTVPSQDSAEAPTGPASAVGPFARGRVAMVLSAIALCVAAVSAALALLAIGRANDAARQASRVGAEIENEAAPAGSAAPESEPSGAETPTEPLTPDPGQLIRTANYTVQYPADELQLQVANCYRVAIDLDEPRVGVEDDSGDLSFHGQCNAPISFTLPEGVVGAHANSGQVTPNECAELVRKAPLADGGRVPIQRGIVLCVATSLDAARTQGITRKIAVIDVRAVSNGGVVNVEVAAWNVPG